MLAVSGCGPQRGIVAHSFDGDIMSVRCGKHRVSGWYVPVFPVCYPGWFDVMWEVVFRKHTPLVPQWSEFSVVVHVVGGVAMKQASFQFFFCRLDNGR